MRCSKCNSPLISGEPFCKICGTKVEDMNKDLEIIDIDFDDEEEFVNEVIENSDDLMDELEDVKLESTVNLEPVSLDEIKNTPVEEVEEEKVEEIEIDLEDDEKPEMSQTLIDIMMRPIDLEDTIKLESQNIEKDIEELKEAKEEEKVEEQLEEEVPTEEEVTEEVVEENPEIIEEEPKKKKEIKSKEHDATTRTVKTLKPNTKDGAGLTIVILAIILIVSIILNVYLFISSNNSEKAPEESGTTTIIKTNKIVFGDYEIAVNNGWTISSEDEVLTLSDNSNEWTSKTFVVSDVSYKDFVNNADDFKKEMKDKKYQFTSNYEKKIDGNKLYIFKGKFESYTTYLIIGSIDKKTVSVTELKFDNEVNDKTLDKVMNTVISIELTNNEKSSIDKDVLSETVKANGEAKEEDTTKKEEK